MYGITQLVGVGSTLLAIPISHMHFKTVYVTCGLMVVAGASLFLFSGSSYGVKMVSRVIWGLGQAPNYVGRSKVDIIELE
jgi:predicted MFS family arabinose efflux permease